MKEHDELKVRKKKLLFLDSRRLGQHTPQSNTIQVDGGALEREILKNLLKNEPQLADKIKMPRSTSVKSTILPSCSVCWRPSAPCIMHM
jgi:hypothetical protein